MQLNIHVFGDYYLVDFALTNVLTFSSLPMHIYIDCTRRC